MKILELFAGYGSQALALKYLGIDVESEISEIDKYAIEAYNQIHGQTKNWGDITKINEKQLGEYEIITYSSPCQDFSNAGLQRGGEKGSGTRSSLLWECERIIFHCKPKYLLMENVSALVSEKFKPCFIQWLKTLDKLGYNNYFQVLNAKDYGIPQNRERIFVVSIRKDIKQTYYFPKKQKLKIRLKDILEENVEEKFYLSDKQVNTFKSSSYNQTASKEQDINGTCSILCARDWKDPKVVQVGNISASGSWDNPQKGRVYHPDGCSPTITCMQGGGLEPKILEMYNPYNKSQIKDITPTQTCGCGSKTSSATVMIKYDNLRIRKLTPKECWRLMGVKDEDYAKLHGISNSQLYKLAGNSIVTNVLMEIFKQIIDPEMQEEEQLQLF